MKIAQKVTELIGNTPLLRLTRWEKKFDLAARSLPNSNTLTPRARPKTVPPFR